MGNRSRRQYELVFVEAALKSLILLNYSKKRKIKVKLFYYVMPNKLIYYRSTIFDISNNKKIRKF